MFVLTYDHLLIEAEKEGLIIKEKPLISSDGRIFGKKIAIRKDIPTLCQKACVLAEEIGHHYTASGNILEQQSTKNIKQERKGRIWAYDTMIGLSGIVMAYERHCSNHYEMADYLGVSEQFLHDALHYYSQKYGNGAVYGQYIIKFIPSLMVAKIY